jgi:hypothetical protein
MTCPVVVGSYQFSMMMQQMRFNKALSELEFVLVVRGGVDVLKPTFTVADRARMAPPWSSSSRRVAQPHYLTLVSMSMDSWPVVL